MTNEEKILEVVKNFRLEYDTLKDITPDGSLTVLVNGFKVTISDEILSYYPTTGKFTSMKDHKVIERGFSFKKFKEMVLSRLQTQPISERNYVVNVPKDASRITINLV